MPERFYGAAAAFVPGKEPAPSPAAPAAPPRETPARAARPPVWLFALVGILLVGGIGFGIWWFLFRTPAAAPPPANVNRAPVANANANRPPTNANRNVNLNANANQNTNVNAPATTTPAAATSTPTDADRNANVNAPVPTGPVRLAVDADADGLTDAEENEIYRSDPARPDSDGDGHLDGVEVFNLYSPTAQAPARLQGTTSVQTATEAAGYSILYPAPWRRQVVDQESMTVAWSAPTGEFVQALLQENPQNLPALDWYLAQAPGVQRSQVAAFTTPSGLSGVRSPDGFTSYVAIATGKILVVNYTLGARTEAAYRRTYEMMVNSLRQSLPAAPPAAATSTPSSATGTPGEAT